MVKALHSAHAMHVAHRMQNVKLDKAKEGRGKGGGKKESAEKVRKRAALLNVSLEVAAQGHKEAAQASEVARRMRALERKAQKTARLLQITVSQAASLNARAYDGDEQARALLNEGRLRSLATVLQLDVLALQSLQQEADAGNLAAKQTLRRAAQMLLAQAVLL